MKTEYISSRQNPLIVWASSLKEKKYREEHSAYLVHGFKLFEEAVKEGANISYIFLHEEKTDRYSSAVEDLLSSYQGEAPKVVVLSASCFEKVSEEKGAQGIITALKILDKTENIIKIYKVEEFVQKTDSVVFLSSVRDPANLGAILRSASAFGFSSVILTPDCADPYNPKTARAAMGALFRMRILTASDPVSCVRELRESGRRVYAAELRDGAIPLGDVKLTRDDVLMIGNEGHGVAWELSLAATGSIYIPISANTESLNASVAASILLWEQSKP